MPQNVTPYGFAWQNYLPPTPLPLAPQHRGAPRGYNPLWVYVPFPKQYGPGDIMDMRNEFNAPNVKVPQYGPPQYTYGGGTSGSLAPMPATSYYPLPLAREWGLAIMPQQRRL